MDESITRYDLLRHAGLGAIAGAGALTEAPPIQGDASFLYVLLRQSPYQSGFFTAGGQAKHSLEAFRFPFVAFRAGSGVSVWGRTPFGKSGSVIVERQATGKRWISVARLRADRNGIFSQPLSAPATTALRARLVSSSETSIPFSLRVPPDRPITPFGCGGPIPC
jgi:hypothetical protein